MSGVSTATTLPEDESYSTMAVFKEKDQTLQPKVTHFWRSRCCRSAPHPVYLLIFITGAFILWNISGDRFEIPRIRIQPPHMVHDSQKPIKQEEKWQQEKKEQDGSWPEQFIRDGKWQRIPGKREVHVYSAFYDDRVTFPLVRVTSVVSQVNETEDHMYCVLTFDKIPTPITQIVPVIKVAIGFGYRLHRTALKEYVLNCQLESMDPPTNVSIVHHPDQAPMIQLPVQVPDKIAKRMNFMVCTCGAYGSTPPHKLIEWIEYLRMFGVDHVTVYNDSIAPESIDVLQYYAKHNVVDLRRTQNLMTDRSRWRIWIHNSPLLNDCLYRNMHKYHKIIVTDLDETIVPRKDDTYLEMLDTIENETCDTCDKELKSGYVFLNAHFFLDHPVVDLNQSRHLVTLHYRQRQPPTLKGWFMKSIIEPRTCSHLNNHICLGVLPIYEGKAARRDVPVTLAMTHHYKYCDHDWKRPRTGINRCEEDRNRSVPDDFMMKFKDKITARVKPIIEDLHLEPL